MYKWVEEFLKRYIVFQGEMEPIPSLNIHIFLPSGVAVTGVDPWVQRLIKISQNVQPDQEAGTLLLGESISLRSFISTRYSSKPKLKYF